MPRELANGSGLLHSALENVPRAGAGALRVAMGTGTLASPVGSGTAVRVGGKAVLVVSVRIRFLALAAFE